MSDPVITRRHKHILEIGLNRPAAYNALNLDRMKMLEEALASATTDRSIKGILITGKGQGISDCAAHPHRQEGIHAFVEKHKPSFQDQ